MKAMFMDKRKQLSAEHGIIYSEAADGFFRYFGWPSLVRGNDNRLYVAVSGFRHKHICPWGKTVMFTSCDEGKTWSMPQIVNDSLIDDRDAGLTTLPDGSMLLSWFTSDTRKLIPVPPEEMKGLLSSWDDDEVRRELGSFLRRRKKDGSWGKRIAVEVTSPHGPILLKNANLLYLGSRFGVRNNAGELEFDMKKHFQRGLGCIVSNDNGENWELRGCIPKPDNFEFAVEPHAIELKDGRILGLVRIEKNQDTHFEIWKTISEDEGRTWSPMEPICGGSPPHILRILGDILLCTYAQRIEPYGIHAMFSCDEGKTWDTDWKIRTDCSDSDLGYPSSVMLNDGFMLSVYYDQGTLCWSRWELPFQK